MPTKFVFQAYKVNSTLKDILNYKKNFGKFHIEKDVWNLHSKRKTKAANSFNLCAITSETIFCNPNNESGLCRY